MAGLFGAPKPPPPKPPAPMPDEESPAVLEAQRRERLRIASRAGRRSTILTDPDNRGVGSDTFSSKTLGA